MAAQVLNNELKLKNFCYNHPDKSAFHRYQWICWDAEHLILRLILAVYIVYAYIHEVVHNCNKSSDNDTENSTTTTSNESWQPRREPYASFEMWCFTVLLVHLVYQCCISFYFTLKNRKVRLAAEAKAESTDVDQKADSKSETSKLQTQTDAESEDDNTPLPCYFKISWVLCDMILPVAPLVTIIYFGALYDGGSIDVFTVNMYIMNTALVFMDQVISARPVKLLHFVAPILFTTTYTIFNYAYWKHNSKEDVVYPDVLDWSSPGQAAGHFFLFTLVFIPIALCCWFVFYRIKLFGYNWRYQKK